MNQETSSVSSFNLSTTESKRVKANMASIYLTSTLKKLKFFSQKEAIDFYYEILNASEDGSNVE